MDIKIIAFCYDFPHEKTVQNLLSLKIHGFNNVKCVAAPKKILNIPQSKIRITPVLKAHYPENVAKVLDYEYIKMDHDSDDITTAVKGSDVGVILGARVLKRHAVNALPIINLHPGLLPFNRGLDNIKHAILADIPQGVTAHIIDEYVDRGYFIMDRVVDIYPDDTLLDIYLRNLNVQRDLLIRSLILFMSGQVSKERLGKGNYFKPMTAQQEYFMMQNFEKYKFNYEEIIKRYYRG